MSSTARYIRLTWVVSAIRWNRKRNNTSTREEVRWVQLTRCRSARYQLWTSPRHQIPLFEGGGFQNHSNVCLVYKSRTIVALFQAFNGFGIVLPRLRETLDNTPRCAILEGVSEVHQLQGVWQVRAAIKWNRKLLPKCAPVNDVANKLRHAKLRQFHPLGLGRYSGGVWGENGRQ